jgi:hypothetical protein
MTDYTHDMEIDNQTASNARSDINNALKALASCSAGTTAPSTTFKGQLWYDTTNNILKMRNEANSAWLNVLYMDQTNGAEILDDTHVVNSSGTQTGLLGDQATGTWETGTGTTESLVSPAKVKASVVAHAGARLTSSSAMSALPVGTYVFAIDINRYTTQEAGDTAAMSSSNPLRVYHGTGQYDITYGTWMYLGREGGNTILYCRVS